MPRREPDARERLVVAALRLFSEQGYDETTVAVIADRAGLTKSAFCRHFPNKRMWSPRVRRRCRGILAASGEASPLDTVAERLLVPLARSTRRQPLRWRPLQRRVLSCRSVPLSSRSG